MRTRAGAEDSARWAFLLAEHLEHLRERRRSEAAQRHARHVLPRLFRHLGREGVRDPCEVGPEHLVRFAAQLARQGLTGHGPLAPASRAAYLGAVKRFFSFLARRGVLLLDPSRELALPRGDRLPREVLSPAEARRLLSVPSARSAIGLRDRALLETLYGTALRAAECLRVDLGELDLRQGVLLVRDGKGRKDRVVPVAGRAAVALDLYLARARPELARQPREGALFLTRSGSRVARSTLGELVRRHARAAGIARPVSPHVLRHSCATHLLQGGADVRHVQELLGHASLQSTQRYTRVAIEDLREVIRRCHPRERARRAGVE